MTTRIISFYTLACILLTAVVVSCDNQAQSANSSAYSPATTEVAEQPATTSELPETESQQAALSSEPATVVPDFTFYILRSGIQFTKADLAKTGNLVFILFDPTCSHCQHEANHIGTHYNEVKDAHFYFVSMNDPALMSTFLETYAKPLVGKDNVELLYDKNAEFINKFHVPSQFPAVYVYGHDGLLKEYWDGERDIKEVIASINK